LERLRRAATSMDLSRQSVAEDIEYTGAQLGKVPTGVCLNKNKRDDPGRESISLRRSFTAHTESEKPFNHSTKEIPEEKKAGMYIQRKCNCHWDTHIQTQGRLLAEREERMRTAKVRGCPDTGVCKLPTEREKRVESNRVDALYSRRFGSVWW
jgi:hypothetical protein